MGGSSAIITADTKAEVILLAREWYLKLNTAWAMFPRIDVTDFPNKQSFLSEGCEEVYLTGIVNAVICVKPMEEFKESFYYKHLKSEQRDKNFGAFVSART